MANGIPPAQAPGQFLDLSQISALNTQRDILKEQMERARALGQPSGRKYATWGGALAGGLGDILGGIAGQTKEAKLAEQLAGNVKQREGLVGGFNQATGQARAALSAAEAMPQGPEREAAFTKALGGLENLGFSAQGAADESMRNMGGGLLQFARDARQEPTRALERTLKAAEISKKQREEQELNDPTSTRTKQAFELAKEFGMSPPEGATAAQILPLLPLGEKAWEAREARSTKEKAATDAATKRTQEVAEGYRKEFFANPIVKDTQIGATALGKIQSAAKKPSAAGDMAIVYNFMKLMDPQTGVKENETASVQQAGPIVSKWVGLYNQVVNGQRLAPDVRADFLNQAGVQFQGQMERYAPLAEQFKRLARESGIAEENVVLPLGFDRQVVERRKAPDGRTIVKYADGTKEVQ